MSSTEAADVGLRERKRRATRLTIQLAVLDLVAASGLDGVTVDQISHVADISPRTFFNYFASKEEALLGDPPELPSDELVDTFVAAEGPLMAGLASLLIEAGRHSMHDVEKMSLRAQLLKQYPQLFARRMATMHQFEDDVASVVSRRLLHQNPGLASAPDIVHSRARLVTLVAFAAMRHAWSGWASGSSTTLPERLDASFAELQALFVEP